MEDILSDAITQTLGPEVINYLTITEAMDAGFNISERRLHQIADPYPVTEDVFEKLSTTPEGVNVIHAKLLLNEASGVIPQDPQFYLNLGHLAKLFVKMLLLHNHGNSLFLFGPMCNDEVRELILPTVIKYDLTKASNAPMKMKFVELALGNDSPTAIKRVIKTGYVVRPYTLSLQPQYTQGFPRTPRMIAFLVNQLIKDPLMTEGAKREGTTRDYFIEVLNRPDISEHVKSKLACFL